MRVEFVESVPASEITPQLSSTPLADSLAEKRYCPKCGPVPPDKSSMYCPKHSLEVLKNYLAAKADSPLNQGLNRLAAAASQQPITPHAA